MGLRVLLTGATGFVGRSLYPMLIARGHQVRCASRDPDAARRREPNKEWVFCDLSRPDSLGPALQGVSATYFLVHAMGAARDYETYERRSANNFVEAAVEAGLERIVYLGGQAPQGTPSTHLRSRMATGAILRASTIPTVELRAAMIIGAGSESWQIVRDLAARLPVMVLPAWLESRSQPIAAANVVQALVDALELPRELVGCYDIPGPEIMSARQILLRVSALRGTRPLTVTVPFVTPSLSSYWISLVTRARHSLARELVHGLQSDLISTGPNLFTVRPQALISFDEAARLAFAEEQAAPLPPGPRWVESAINRIARRLRPARTPVDLSGRS